jgi:hypothetical protein
MAGRRVSPRWLIVAAVLVVVVGGVFAAVQFTGSDDRPNAGRPSSTAASSAGSAAPCTTRVRVVTATPFAPVLRQAAADVSSGTGCVGVDVTTADGSGAATVVSSSRADVWIADDSSWPQLPGPEELAQGQGSTVAISPMYLVRARSAPASPAAADTWLGLGRMLGRPAPARLVVADPSGSGAGMVAIGALAGAVLKADGPLVSALDMMRAWQYGTTVSSAAAAMPKTAAQVAVVPEYALLADGRTSSYDVVAPSDGAALMRFSWLPTAAAVGNPTTSAALTRLRLALSGPRAVAALSAAGLRGPSWPTAAPPGAAKAGLPAVPVASLPTMAEHLMYHVLSTWRPALRRTNMLVVVDVSGSMAEKLPGTNTTKIDLIRQGIDQVNALLPPSAQLGLWQFGSQLAPPNDWEPVTAPALLTSGQRGAITTAAAKLVALPVGTGLYDTILAAYRYQQTRYLPGVPNQVIIFTDGVNQDDPVTISLGQLKTGLAALPGSRWVQLSVFGLGGSLPATSLTGALGPVSGQVDQLTNPDDVIGAFVHAVSGALSGYPG